MLKNADEIRIDYKDKEILYKYMEELQDKTYILEIPKDLEFIDWNEVKMFSESGQLIYENSVIQSQALAEAYRKNFIEPISNE